MLKLISALLVATGLLATPPSSQAVMREGMKSASASPIATLSRRAGAEAPPTQLYGVWVADNVDATIGQVKIRLVFSRQGNVTVLAWSDLPLIGQVRDLEGPFTVRGDTISSTAIRDGKSARFSFQNAQLVLRLKSGKTVYFTRE